MVEVCVVRRCNANGSCRSVAQDFEHTASRSRAAVRLGPLHNPRIPAKLAGLDVTTFSNLQMMQHRRQENEQ